MNKKGSTGSQLLIFIFLFLLVVIAVAIAASVYLFFGEPYEFREIDAKILYYKIDKCINENENFLEDFYNKCRISKEALEKHNIIFKVCVDNKDCLTGGEGVISFGGNFQSCGFIGTKGNNNFPRCYMKTENIRGRDYTIITGSNQFLVLRRQGI